MTYAARALSSSSRAVLTVALAFIANPIEVDRVACQGVRNRSTMILSCCNRASPTWNQLFISKLKELEATFSIAVP